MAKNTWFYGKKYVNLWQKIREPMAKNTWKIYGIIVCCHKLDKTKKTAGWIV